MDSCFKYKWRTSREEGIIPAEPKPFQEKVFFIQLQSKEFVVINNLQNEEVMKELLRPVKVKNVFIGKDLLLSGADETQSFLFDSLSSIGVPVHLLCCAIDSIVAFARNMAYFTPNQDILPMAFDFAAYIAEFTDES